MLTPVSYTHLDVYKRQEDGPVRNGPALVLLDLNLPDMSGIDILAKIKSDDSPLRRTPVVVLTTTDDKIEIQRCYDPVSYTHLDVYKRQRICSR